MTGAKGVATGSGPMGSTAGWVMAMNMGALWLGRGGRLFCAGVTVD